MFVYCTSPFVLCCVVCCAAFVFVFAGCTSPPPHPPVCRLLPRLFCVNFNRGETMAQVPVPVPFPKPKKRGLTAVPGSRVSPFLFFGFFCYLYFYFVIVITERLLVVVVVVACWLISLFDFFHFRIFLPLFYGHFFILLVLFLSLVSH